MQIWSFQIGSGRSNVALVIPMRLWSFEIGSGHSYANLVVLNQFRSFQYGSGRFNVALVTRNRPRTFQYDSTRFESILTVSMQLWITKKDPGRSKPSNGPSECSTEIFQIVFGNYNAGMAILM